jgi:hypothetical protein
MERAHAGAGDLPPDSSTLQCLGACLTATAAPRSLPDERRLVRFAMQAGYPFNLGLRQFLTDARVASRLTA